MAKALTVTTPTAPLTTFDFTAGGRFVLDAPGHVPAIWGDGDDVLWAQGEPLVIAGPPGVGKSTVLSNVLRARLGLESGALGYSVEPAERVLYLACDRPAQLRRLHRRIFKPSERAVLNERLVVWEGPPPADVAKEPDLLLRMAAAASADTVIIDSLKDVAMRLSDDDVGAAVNRSLQLCVAAEVEVAALHHTRKASSSGANPKELDDLYGSRWLTAGAGSVLVLWGKAGDSVIEMFHRKQPANTVGPLKIRHDSVTGRSTVVHGIKISELLHDAGSRGLTAAEAAELETGQAANDTSRKRAKRELDRLVKGGFALADAPPPGGSGGTAPVRYTSIDQSGAMSDDETTDRATDTS
ncbi:MAG: AAA family ATPase [Microthrixaceae bacterium]